MDNAPRQHLLGTIKQLQQRLPFSLPRGHLSKPLTTAFDQKREMRIKYCNAQATGSTGVMLELMWADKTPYTAHVLSNNPDIEVYYENLTGNWCFDIRASQYEVEDRVGICFVQVNLMCLEEQDMFGEIPFSAKWSNEELCTFCCKTTSFSSSQWIFFSFSIFCPSIRLSQHTVFLDNKAKWKSRTLSKGEIAAMIEWLRHYRRGHDGPYQCALFFYNRIISPPITPLIRCYRNCNNWKGIHGKRERTNR